MTERVTTKIMVLKEHLGTALKMLDEHDCIAEIERDLTDGPDLVELTFYQVRGGYLHAEQSLQANGIPYDKYWESSADFEAGSLHFRVGSGGTGTVKEFYGDEKALVDLSELEKAFEENTVGELISRKRAYNDVMSWAEQEKAVKAVEMLKEGAK